MMFISIDRYHYYHNYFIITFVIFIHLINFLYIALCYYYDFCFHYSLVIAHLGKEYSYPSDVWAFGLSLMTVALGKLSIATNGGYWGILQRYI